MNEHPATSVEMAPAPHESEDPPPAEAPVEPVGGESLASSGGGEPAPTSEGGESAPTASDDGFLDDLELPSLVSAPEPLGPGAVIGPDGHAQVVEYLNTRGRVNLYAARWRQDDGTEAEIELREGPADHGGLRREAEILASVQYAMLPRVYGAWDADDRRYLAVGRTGGQTLADALAAGLSAEQVLSSVVQLAQAVRRLHRAGWALLGLTPADVALGRPSQIRYLWHAGRIGEPAPQALQVAGYSAPELASREPVSGKEDVYTLGAILFEALADHRLGDDTDLADLPARIRLPGGPQLLADALAPADERPHVEDLYRRLLELKRRQAETALSLEVASATSLGLNPTRLVNEDSSCYAVWARTGAEGVRETALLCVADGMGGMEAGEVASQTAIAVLMRGAVGMLWPPSPLGSPTGATAPDAAAGSDAATDREPAPDASVELGGPRLDPAALVRQAATAVHTAGQGRDLGTTLTCLAVHDGELTLAHVGDTRAYLLRGGALTQITADHSLVAAMVASGVITPEEARGHPDSNKVLRSLGSQRELPPSYVDGLDAAYGQPSLQLATGDVLLVCSDGVWGPVSDGEIRNVLMEALDAQVAAQALIDRALAVGAPDNATAVVARCVRRPVL
jgi:protein phosphatase